MSNTADINETLGTILDSSTIPHFLGRTVRVREIFPDPDQGGVLVVFKEVSPCPRPEKALRLTHTEINGAMFPGQYTIVAEAPFFQK